MPTTHQYALCRASSALIKTARILCTISCFDGAVLFVLFSHPVEKC
jgi:hypothetical protein